MSKPISPAGKPAPTAEASAVTQDATIAKDSTLDGARKELDAIKQSAKDLTFAWDELNRWLNAMYRDSNIEQRRYNMDLAAKALEKLR